MAPVLGFDDVGADEHHPAAVRRNRGSRGGFDAVIIFQIERAASFRANGARTQQRQNGEGLHFHAAALTKAPPALSDRNLDPIHIATG